MTELPMLKPQSVRTMTSAIVASFAVLFTAHTAVAQTITVTSREISRQVPERDDDQKPLWINYHDCVEGDVLGFPVTLGDVSIQNTVQVWAGTEDCSEDDRRNSTSMQCWKVFEGSFGTREAVVQIRAQDIVAQRFNSAPGSGTKADCEDGFDNQAIVLTFIVSDQAGAKAISSTTYTGTGVDVQAPPPPSGVQVDEGETRLNLSWTVDEVSQLAGYNFYCDAVGQPVGAALAAGALPTGILQPIPTDASAAGGGDSSVPMMASGGALPMGSGGALPMGSGGALPMGSGGALPMGSGGALPIASGGAPPASGGSVGVASGGTPLTDSGIADAASLDATGPAPTGPNPNCPSAVVVAGQRPDPGFYCGGVRDDRPSGGQAEGLMNDVEYAIAVAGVDDVGNVSLLSSVSCGTPIEVSDFFELYRAAGGNGGGGFCSISATRSQSLLAALSVGLLGLIVRRRRNR